MERRFSLHRRKSTYYAQLFNPDTGRYMTARCTGADSRNAALIVVAGWLRDGWPTGRQAKPRPVAEAIAIGTLLAQLRSAPLTAEDAGRILAVLKERDLIDGGAVAKGGPGSELFTDFLERFWTYDTSPYVREKLAHGQRIGKRRCYDATLTIRAHWFPAFRGRRLAEIQRKDVQDLGMVLRDSGLAPKSVNNAMEYGTVALRWAAQNGMIATDPTAGVRRFSGAAKARGVLTPEEAAALFGVAWDDERARVGNLVAATTGMRAGEVVALRPEDIGEDRLLVRHSWSEEDGLKGTKTEEERTVPLLPEVRAELLRLAAGSPHGPGGFVFYGADPARPMRTEILRDGLNLALLALSLPKPEDRKDRGKARAALVAWRARGVCVHSWRHYYIARMADRIGERTMRMSGHKTAAVFEHYANHRTEEQLREAGAAAAEVFANVVPFSRAEAAS